MEDSLICTLVTGSLHMGAGSRESGSYLLICMSVCPFSVYIILLEARAVELLFQVADHLATIFEVPMLCRLIFDRGGVSYGPLWSRVPLSDLGPPITVPASLKQEEVSTWTTLERPRVDRVSDVRISEFLGGLGPFWARPRVACFSMATPQDVGLNKIGNVVCTSWYATFATCHRGNTPGTRLNRSCPELKTPLEAQMVSSSLNTVRVEES